MEEDMKDKTIQEIILKKIIELINITPRLNVSFAKQRKMVMQLRSII